HFGGIPGGSRTGGGDRASARIDASRSGGSATHGLGQPACSTVQLTPPSSPSNTLVRDFFPGISPDTIQIEGLQTLDRQRDIHCGNLAAGPVAKKACGRRNPLS